jgi:hypothetical protein
VLTAGLSNTDLKLAPSEPFLVATITDQVSICRLTLSSAARLSTLIAAAASSAAISPSLTARAGSRLLNFAPVHGVCCSRSLHLSALPYQDGANGKEHLASALPAWSQGRRLTQAYGDYWLYGGLGYIPEDEKAKGDVYREIAKQNLNATPLTYELFTIEKEVTAEQRAKDILIAKGSIVAGKRLSGAQRRKRRQLTLELEAEDRKEKDKNIWICPE